MEFIVPSREIAALRRLKPRQVCIQIVLAGHAVTFTYMIWKLFCILFGTDNPIVCVLSGSMEPGFKKGDILFLRKQGYDSGDIVVYQVYDNAIPIVHRVIKKTHDGKMLTKGDNNRYDDVGLYKPGRSFIVEEETRAGVVGYVPFLGLPTIWINTVPGMRIFLIFFAGLTVFLNRE